jgi:hypothetical protein
MHTFEDTFPSPTYPVTGLKRKILEKQGPGKCARGEAQVTRYGRWCNVVYWKAVLCGVSRGRRRWAVARRAVAVRSHSGASRRHAPGLLNRGSGALVTLYVVVALHTSVVRSRLGLTHVPERAVRRGSGDVVMLRGNAHAVVGHLLRGSGCGARGGGHNQRENEFSHYAFHLSAIQTTANPGNAKTSANALPTSGSVRITAMVVRNRMSVSVSFCVLFIRKIISL